MTEKVDAQLTIKICDLHGRIKGEGAGLNAVHLNYQEAFSEGDRILIGSDHWPIPLKIRVSEFQEESCIYLNNNMLEYPVPFGEEKKAYHPRFLSGKPHSLYVKTIPEEEWLTYRNLSRNPFDRRGESSYYPHCSANVETRNEGVFAARSVIDGVIEQSCHGDWPYQSWGDDENPLAEILIDFGRTVLANRIDVYLRADFPHDSYWKNVTFLFSDTTTLVVDLQKTAEVQKICFDGKRITWVKMMHLQKGEDVSPFPALTQLDVFGCDIK